MDQAPLYLIAQQRILRSEILDCAAATAYESAEQLDATNCKMVVAVAYLLETAQELVESAMDAKHREG